MTVTRRVTLRLPFLILYLTRIDMSHDVWKRLHREWVAELHSVLGDRGTPWTKQFLDGLRFAVPLALGGARLAARAEAETLPRRRRGAAAAGLLVGAPGRCRLWVHPDSGGVVTAAVGSGSGMSPDRFRPCPPPRVGIHVRSGPVQAPAALPRRRPLSRAGTKRVDPFRPLLADHSGRRSGRGSGHRRMRWRARSGPKRSGHGPDPHSSARRLIQ